MKKLMVKKMKQLKSSINKTLFNFYKMFYYISCWALGIVFVILKYLLILQLET
jgi:hypothetical protein